MTLDADEHHRRGTYRKDRHGPHAQFAHEAQGSDPEPDELEVDRNGEPLDPKLHVTEADRAAVLRGLPPAAKTIATALLDTFWDFHPAALFTLRCYALSCHRLEALQTARPPQPAKIQAEIAANVALAAALKLG